MAKDLPKMNTPTCIIWGKNDSVTPPEVAEGISTNYYLTQICFGLINADMLQ